jgi:glycosyltransferase involved in cell wall biosynthesis
MRIGLIAPVWFPVPPVGYGGIERVVSLLADGLVADGHEVVLFASGDSETDAELEAVFPTAPSEWIGHTYWEVQHLLQPLAGANDLDILNDHTGMLGLILGGLVQTPFVHTVHGPLDGRPGDMYEQICEIVPDCGLISISMSQRRARPGLAWVANCHNALDLSLYPFTPADRESKRGDYLLFLGRMCPEKGAHHAVTVAQEAGVPLKIAAKCREPLERQYFDSCVEPHLSPTIEYVGEVGHEDKVELLRHARALVFPIEWEEPFGLAMIEAMACGVPVVATRRGSVPEVVEHGLSGIVVDRYTEIPAALELADRLDPSEIRAEVEEKFSPARMVADYVTAYQRTIARAGQETAASTSRALSA